MVEVIRTVALVGLAFGSSYGSYRLFRNETNGPGFLMLIFALLAVLAI